MRVAILFLILPIWGCSSMNGTYASVYPSSRPASVETAVGVEVVFTEYEIKIIRAYYETYNTSRGKGKHKRKSLPPGIAKNLERGKPLPPGIAKQALPYDLLRRLPPPPDGYERIILAGKVLLVELATQIVRDVLNDIVFG